MAKTYSRRRAIAIFAAVAGLPLLTGARSVGDPVTWNGYALGAPATLILNHHDRAEAGRLIERVVAEVARLEAILSLYREDSALVELNRAGFLIAPPPDLVALLDASRIFWKKTGGAFDPTVQTLWETYRDHFSRPDADPAGPSQSDLGRALSRVGFHGVRHDEDKVVMGRKMALTLNGVAQGYITDRIVDTLRESGVTSCLVDMGEERAIGSRLDGSPWRVGLAESQDSEMPDQIVRIVDRAVATSSMSGFHFDEAGHFGHIIDPRKGAVPALYRRVSVVADDAVTADALSTAFSLMQEDSIGSAIQAFPEVTVDLVHAAGSRIRLGRPV